MVAIDKPHAVEIALVAIVFQIVDKRHVHAARIVVGIHQVAANEMAAVRSAKPPTGFGRNQNVLQLLIGTVLEGIASGSVMESGSVTVSVQLHILDTFQMTGSEWQIVLLVILETLLAAGLFAVLFAYRRMWLRIRKRGVDLLYQGMTLPEFQEMYEEVMRTGTRLQPQPSGWEEVLVYLRGSSFRYQLE